MELQRDCFGVEHKTEKVTCKKCSWREDCELVFHNKPMGDSRKEELEKRLVAFRQQIARTNQVMLVHDKKVVGYFNTFKIPDASTLSGSGSLEEGGQSKG